MRRAEPDDLPAVAELQHRFQLEFSDPSPGAEALAARFAELTGPGGDTVVLVAGSGPDGHAVLRFRRSLLTPRQECYLSELYVSPEARGHGLGRALMEAVLVLAREREADYIELITEENNAARRLYESFGFGCREGGPDGPLNLYYELEL